MRTVKTIQKMMVTDPGREWLAVLVLHDHAAFFTLDDTKRSSPIGVNNPMSSFLAILRKMTISYLRSQVFLAILRQMTISYLRYQVFLAMLRKNDDLLSPISSLFGDVGKNGNIFISDLSSLFGDLEKK